MLLDSVFYQCYDEYNEIIVDSATVLYSGAFFVPSSGRKGSENMRVLSYIWKVLDKTYPRDPNPDHWKTINGAKVHIDETGKYDGGAGGKFNGRFHWGPDWKAQNNNVSNLQRALQNMANQKEAEAKKPASPPPAPKKETAPARKLPEFPGLPPAKPGSVREKMLSNAVELQELFAEPWKEYKGDKLVDFYDRLKAAEERYNEMERNDPLPALNDEVQKEFDKNYPDARFAWKDVCRQIGKMHREAGGDLLFLPDRVKPLAENARHGYKISGAKQGKPMSHDDADNGSVNPEDNFFSAPKYRKNCQTCVAVYEARRRGYNVVARPKMATNKMQQELSRNPGKMFFDPETGREAKPEIPNINWHQKNYIQNYYDFMDKTIKPGERHIIWFLWKDKVRAGKLSGHTVNVYKNKDGELVFKDNQIPNYRSETVGKAAIEPYLYEMYFGSQYVPRLLRVDDKEMNLAYADKVMRKA